MGCGQSGTTVIPAPFTYLRVSSVQEALDALAEFCDDAKLLAGGHSLIPLMKFRLATPKVLVDISGITELSGVSLEGDSIVVGAATRHATLEHSPVVKEHCGLLAYTASLVGDPQVRNRGTIGGSVAHGDSASDLPVSLLAMDAQFTVQSRTGTRTIAAAEFFLGFWQTALTPTEVLINIKVPRQKQGWSYQKFTIRSQDWATVSTAIYGKSVALGAMADIPMRATAVESALAQGAEISEAALLADHNTSPSSDTRASADYRRHLARILTEDGLRESLTRH